ncbi:MAG: hypothetical protein ACRD2M_06670 [Terriglobales bacterium]
MRKLAKAKRLSANRVLVDLIAKGIEAREREREAFLALAEQLSSCEDNRERRKLKEELAIMTFGS